MNRKPYTIKVYNLPQNVKGGIKIHGFNDPAYDLPENVVLLFTHLEGMEAFCNVEGTKNQISIDANTLITEIGGDEYKVAGA